MARKPSQTTEVNTLEKRKAELATLNSDIAALTQAADCVEQVTIWAWDAWCAGDELSERESNDKHYAGLEKLSNQSEALKAEVDALLKSYKDALPFACQARLCIKGVSRIQVRSVYPTVRALGNFKLTA